MKTLLSFLPMLAFVTLARAASEAAITPKEAAKHISEAVTVVGEIDQVKDFRGGSEALDLGGAYPHQALVIYISSAVLSEMPGFFEGEKIEVKGIVTLYRGKPEIVLDDPNHVKNLTPKISP